MLTDTGDTVYDPFAGSCVTGEVCESLKRTWICCEIVPEYVEGAKGRFITAYQVNGNNEADHYKILNPSVLWNESSTDGYEDLPDDGGKKRPSVKNKATTNLPEETPALRKSETRLGHALQPKLLDSKDRYTSS
jgi:site-specific DNA-methyltransferase (cytosine-N4-specific)